MKLAVLEKLKPYMGQKVEVLRRHVTNVSWLEGTFEGIEGRGNWTYIQIRCAPPSKEVRLGGVSFYASGVRTIGLNRIIQVRTADRKVWK